MRIERTFRRLISLFLVLALSAPGIVFADPAKAQEYYSQAALEYEKQNYSEAAELLYQAYAEDANLIYVYNRILALQAAGRYDDALKELNVFANRMANDAEKRFEDVPQIKTQLEERIKLANDKTNNSTNTNNATNTASNNNTSKQIEDPGPTPKKSGPGIVAISLLAGGGLILGAGALMATEVFVPDLDKYDETVGVIEAFARDGDRNAYSTDLIRIWGTNTANEAIDEYEVARTNRDTQQTVSIILMGVGGALIIGGVIAWVVNASSADDASSGDDVPVSADAIQLAPTFGPEGIGAQFILSF